MTTEPTIATATIRAINAAVCHVGAGDSVACIESDEVTKIYLAGFLLRWVMDATVAPARTRASRRRRTHVLVLKL